MHQKTIRISLAALVFASCPLAAQPSLIYFEENGGSGNPRGLYNFDPASGISTLRTTVGGAIRFFGLHIQPGTDTVYAISAPSSHRLYTMDIDTGDFTFIATITPDIGDIAFDPTTGILYGIERNNPWRLYTIDPQTGAGTYLSTTDDSVRCGMVISPDGTFYGFSIGGILSTFDPTTGATTLVGGSHIGSVVEDAVWASDDHIYFTLFNGNLYQVDPATGAQTHLGSSGMGSGLLGLIEEPDPQPPCYANCDGSTTEPVLTVNDFTCFINEFASAQTLPPAQQIEHYANCDGSTTSPVLTVNDFTCFINEFAQGCP